MVQVLTIKLHKLNALNNVQLISADTLIQWLTNGCFDALEKRYVSASFVWSTIIISNLVEDNHIGRIFGCGQTK